jgi:hypothetical protein
MTAPVGARLTEHLEERARHAVYSTIVVLAVIIALQEATVGAGEALSYVLGAALATALAEIYADYIGTTIRKHRHLTSEERNTAVRSVAAGLMAALVPVAFLVLAVLDLISVQTALDAAKWTGTGALGAYAFFANRLAGFSTRRSALVGLGFTLVGAFLVLLKAAVH